MRKVNSMTSRPRSIPAIILALIFVAAQYLSGQGATAAISGTVLDPSGAAIPGASIAVKNVGTGLLRSVTSDTEGRYFARELPIGGYEIEAKHADFQTVVRQGIQLTVGSQPVIDVQLPVGTAEQTVKRYGRHFPSGNHQRGDVQIW